MVGKKLALPLGVSRPTEQGEVYPTVNAFHLCSVLAHKPMMLRCLGHAPYPFVCSLCCFVASIHRSRFHLSGQLISSVPHSLPYPALGLAGEDKPTCAAVEVDPSCVHETVGMDLESGPTIGKNAGNLIPRPPW